jgi:hypothetical protein
MLNEDRQAGFCWNLIRLYRPPDAKLKLGLGESLRWSTLKSLWRGAINTNAQGASHKEDRCGMKPEITQHLHRTVDREQPRESNSHAGGLLTYLAAVVSNLARDLARSPARDCVLCCEAILSTQIAVEDDGNTVHAVCREMKGRKRALVESAREQCPDCSLCGEKVEPLGIYFHEAGITVSYSCPEQGHEKPNVFSLPIVSDETRRVGTWEARLRERLKEKGYVRCCECGRLLRADSAKLLGPGWYYCGCVPDLWQTGR